MAYVAYLVILSALLHSSRAQCLPEGIYSEQFGKCYYFITSTFSFKGADDECGTKNGGRLVSIHNAFEEQFVSVNAQQKFGSNDYWIGLSDTMGTDDWTWEDGKPLDYSNWANGFPMSVSGMRCVAATSTTNKWFNTQCSEKKTHAICDVRVIHFGTTTPTTTTTTGGPYTAAPRYCSSGAPKIGMCVGDFCPPGYGCESGWCCRQCGENDVVGECISEECPAGLFCDTTAHGCCPNLPAEGDCTLINGVGSCPKGQVCYPATPNGPLGIPKCYQICSGVGTDGGPAIGGDCPVGYTDVMGICCDKY